jgi:hypothetical protein
MAGIILPIFMTFNFPTSDINIPIVNNSRSRGNCLWNVGNDLPGIAFS